LRNRSTSTTSLLPEIIEFHENAPCAWHGVAKEQFGGRVGAIVAGVPGAGTIGSITNVGVGTITARRQRAAAVRGSGGARQRRSAVTAPGGAGPEPASGAVAAP
jgi:hypothetical protein